MKIKKKIKHGYTSEDYVFIRVADKHRFQEIALLVDKPSYIKSVRRLRERLSVTIPIFDPKAEIMDIFMLDNWKKRYQQWASKNSLAAEVLSFWMKRVRILFLFPEYLEEYIKQAILLRVVFDFSSDVRILSENDRFTKPTIAIFPTLYTTDEEIKESLRKAKEKMKFFSIIYEDTKVVDTKSSIDKYRDWYWKHVLGMTQQKIADEWNVAHGDDQIEYTHVGKGINTYTKMLLS